MRILHLDSGREMRGGQWQALRLHRALTDRGHDSLLLARDESPLLAVAQREKLPCDVLYPFRLAATCRGFEIVHAHDARSHTLGAAFARCPLVVSRRVAFPIQDSMLSRWKYGRARLFIAVSQYVANQLIRGGVDPSRIEVVYDGVPVVAEPANGDQIIAPHTLDPQKGMALAEEAARLANVEITLSEDLDNDLPRARALIYLTQSEGLGSGILLGMAYGVTVIASRVGGIPEIIEDGVNGLLVENSPAAVASAIARIDRAFGAAARTTAAQRFTIEQMIAGTLQAYEKALRNV